LTFLAGPMIGRDRWLAAHTSFFPPFRAANTAFSNSLFLCGIVVGIMILPIVTSISREVMSQTPREACEAALALGGTRWGMITDVILPFSRNGIIGAALLGLGRAAGETIAVDIILATTNTAPWWPLNLHVLNPGGGAIAPLIADWFTQVPTRGLSALTLAALTLFVTTLLINLTDRVFVARASTAAA
jgi:phosphate transport system permease protein